MMDAYWGFTEQLGQLFKWMLLVFGVIIILFMGYFVALPSKYKEELNQFKQQAIEHGFASYKVDSKGVVTFEWNK